MGFGPIRVINEDRVAPAGGFATHPHSEMEIVSYVLDGALEHRDSLGTGSVIRPGDVQRMSAGTGIRHSEFNASQSEPVHFLQIWILPEAKGLQPSYEQKRYTKESKRGQLRLVGSRTGRDGSVIIHRDVDLYAAILGPQDCVTHTLTPERGLWLQVARGGVEVGGQVLDAGDGIAVSDAGEFRIAGKADESEVLLFDFAK